MISALVVLRVAVDVLVELVSNGPRRIVVVVGPVMKKGFDRIYSFFLVSEFQNGIPGSVIEQPKSFRIPSIQNWKDDYSAILFRLLIFRFFFRPKIFGH